MDTVLTVRLRDVERVTAQLRDTDTLGADLGEARVIERGTELLPATTERLGGIIVGSGLLVTEAGVLSVDTADAAEQDNTRPITSAAVHVELGNIEALLAAL